MRAVWQIALCGAVAVAQHPIPGEEAFFRQLEMLPKFIGKDPTPSPWCIAKNCLHEGRKCLFDSNCRNAIKCTAACGKGVNQTCIFQCTSDYENDVYDNLLYCMFNKNDCMGTKKGYDKYQACKAINKVTPLAKYRNESLTPQVARDLVMRGGNRGDWMVAKGKSAAYDCFDCQFLYWLQKPDGRMTYVADYKIHKSDGGVRWNHAVYNATEWASSVGRYSIDSDNYGGLAHFEDWRLLAADESDNPQWLAFYYCGSAPGVGEAYEGAFILTPDGALPSTAVESQLTKMFSDVGIELQCKTDNSNCAGHPAPPTAHGLAIVV
eukprot:TRINITY_DN15676_c0_g1_i1.p1 TRINITY_DN15676_c0_g1~~TRINITY_DN15676_c0_g1_i1.p1  ORF type:complete len:322 (-),score=70.20 TRINITY_DN15676_c0_g1_i1:294-1259(-)